MDQRCLISAIKETRMDVNGMRASYTRIIARYSRLLYGVIRPYSDANVQRYRLLFVPLLLRRAHRRCCNFNES